MSLRRLAVRFQRAFKADNISAAETQKQQSSLQQAQQSPGRSTSRLQIWKSHVADRLKNMVRAETAAQRMGTQSVPSAQSESLREGLRLPTEKLGSLGSRILAESITERRDPLGGLSLQRSEATTNPAKPALNEAQTGFRADPRLAAGTSTSNQGPVPYPNTSGGGGTGGVKVSGNVNAGGSEYRQSQGVESGTARHGQVSGLDLKDPLWSPSISGSTSSTSSSSGSTSSSSGSSGSSGSSSASSGSSSSGSSGSSSSSSASSASGVDSTKTIPHPDQVDTSAYPKLTLEEMYQEVQRMRSGLENPGSEEFGTKAATGLRPETFEKKFVDDRVAYYPEGSGVSEIPFTAKSQPIVSEQVGSLLGGDTRVDDPTKAGLGGLGEDPEDPDDGTLPVT